MGRLLASASNDTSWRLWDLQEQRELLLQEGHNHPVYCVDFHMDGSLAITGSLDASGRIWDLRTGRSIMVLQGHSGPVLSAIFKGNGYQVATGSADNSIRIWDMRAGGSNRQNIQVLPAHSNNVASLALAAVPLHKEEKYLPYQAEALISASYDGTVKVWSGQDSKAVCGWKAHESQVTSVAFTCNSTTKTGYIATGSFDRTFKLWKTE